MAKILAEGRLGLAQACIVLACTLPTLLYAVAGSRCQLQSTSARHRLNGQRLAIGGLGLAVLALRF